MEINAVLPPVLAIFQQFERAPSQRMEWMSDAEIFLRTVVTGCD